MEVEAREDSGLQFFQKLQGFFSKYSKTPNKTEADLLLNEKGLFVDGKQPFDSKIFINDTIEHQNVLLNKLKDFKISGCIGRSWEKYKLSYEFGILNSKWQKSRLQYNENCPDVIK